MSELDEPRGALDLAHLAAQTGGDLSLQRDLLDLFVLQSAEFVAQMRSLARCDPAAAGDLVHRVKGSARAIGAFELSGAAAELECALSAGRGPTALEPLAAALARALSAIEAYLRTLPSHCGV
jgi:HPt (histidine-containing phosphotransfer) domain-containing protein